MKIIEESCGCENVIDIETGILRCHQKCGMHKRMNANQVRGLAYYQKLGTVGHDGRPANNDCYISELEAFMGGIDLPQSEDELLLEIGCGMSPYVTYIRNMGYTYMGLDMDSQAANWTQRTYRVSCIAGLFPETKYATESINAVLMAHSLEHMKDVTAVVLECHRILKRNGVLYIIVPDDSDKVNSDHLWFFTKDGLCKLLERNCFVIEHCDEAQIVVKEKFIYVKARKL